MKYTRMNNLRGCYITFGFKYLAQPYIANLSPDFVPVIRYQVVDLIDDQIVSANLSEEEALQWLEDVEK